MWERCGNGRVRALVVGHAAASPAELWPADHPGVLLISYPGQDYGAELARRLTDWRDREADRHDYPFPHDEDDCADCTWRTVHLATARAAGGGVSEYDSPFPAPDPAADRAEATEALYRWWCEQWVAPDWGGTVLVRFDGYGDPAPLTAAVMVAAFRAECTAAPNDRGTEWVVAYADVDVAMARIMEHAREYGGVAAERENRDYLDAIDRDERRAQLRAAIDEARAPERRAEAVTR